MKRHKATLIELEINGEKILSKDCSKCLIIKPLEDFNKRSNGLGKKDSRCRDCYNKTTKQRKSEYDKAYRKKNETPIKERRRVGREENREVARMKEREYYYKNRERRLESMLQYRIKNKEKLQKYHKEYYIKNIDKIRKYRFDNADSISKYSKKYYAENRELYAERWAKYFSANKEAIRESQRHYYRDNAEEVCERWRQYYRTDKGQLASKRASHRRRERESLTEINFSVDEWLFCLEFFKYTCAYCGDAEEDMTMDHFIPVSKLGSLISSNVIPCCSSCNSSKRDSDFFEWYRKQEYYSLDAEQKVLGYLFDRDDERIKVV